MFIGLFLLYNIEDKRPEKYGCYETRFSTWKYGNLNMLPQVIVFKVC